MGITIVLLAHVAATLFMTGLIWYVQVVHYPLFRLADPARFAQFEADHSRFTARVVVPPMLVEFATAVVLVIVPHPILPLPLAWIGFALLVVVWWSTWALQVPMHVVLTDGYDEAAHDRLVRTNWIRTIGWTLRSALLFTVIGKLLLQHS
ncbi:MAG: hypothetical protein HKN20_17990 [Gemmatimonadetes bacterium]|nr:hypothetical protein [Gemmatimonadota bacterium]